MAFLRVAFFFAAIVFLLYLDWDTTGQTSRAQPYVYRYTVHERAFSLLIYKIDESEESSKRARHIQG